MLPYIKGAASVLLCGAEWANCRLTYLTMSKYQKSEILFARAKHVLAGGVSSEFRKFSHPHPLCFSHAHGSRIVDVDGNEYLDFALSQGPVTLGHGHPAVQAAVNAAAEEMQLGGSLHTDEVELAEKLQRLIPCAELMRFSVTGSEADHTAIRTARAVTGKNKFLRFEGHYHGWFDNMAYGVGGVSAVAMGDREQPSALPWTQGLPSLGQAECILLPWNDLELVERTVQKNSGDIAAIITEPIMCNSGCIEPQPGFLKGLRTLCDTLGMALIFDEVITGFRVHLGGAQAHYGVTPDLAIFAKAIANGYPLSVIAGRHKWMQPIAEGKVIHAGTTNASNPSIAAALATLTIMENEKVHAKLHSLGLRLAEGLRAAARDAGHHMLVQGPGPMLQVAFGPGGPARDYRDMLQFDKTRLSRFVFALQERGIRILSRGLWYISGAHSESEIDHAVDTVRAVLAEL